MLPMDGIGRVTVTILRAPFTRRALLDLRFCLLNAVTGALGFALVATVLVPSLLVSGSVIGTVVGLVGVVTAIRFARLLAAAHRWVLRLATGARVTAPPPPFQPGSGPLGRLDRRLRDRDGWRAVGCTGIKLPFAVAEGYAVTAVGMGLVLLGYPLGWALFRNHPAGTRLGPLIAALPVPHEHWAIETIGGTWTASLAGAGCVLAGVWLARGISLADARVMSSLLGPSRVSELERTRAIAVADAVAALRRVERDLHDGAQVRLAAVTMNLGMARERAADDTLRELLDAAQTGVGGALADLRRIARGIHPPPLDSGLGDALASLAASSPIPAQVQVNLPQRPSPAIETMAYFCVAELLANAIKHSAASAIEILVTSERTDFLQVRVADDGTGEADPSRGTGLRGLAQRASTVDGTLHVSSPAGGPTAVTVQLPMRLRGGQT